MCAPSQGAMLPYGLKVPSPYFPFGPNGGLTQAHLSALDFQRSQLNDYNVQVQFGLRNYQNSIGLSPFHTYISDPYTQAYFYKHDHRARFVQEEPKPSHSYIGLIGMAILNSKEKKLVLSDIYQWILDNYPYFRTRGPGWRNSIRHNLSLNDCFIKAGRSANGKGHYWAVHPANVEDFERGDFRRRRAQRKVRRHMGLSVPDDEDSPTPSPTQPWHHHDIAQELERNNLDPISPTDEQTLRHNFTRSESEHPVFCHPTPAYGLVQVQHRKQSRKRLFDMASLLAPDDDDDDVIKNDEQKIKNERISNKNIHASGFDFRAIHELTLHEGQVNSVLDHMKTKESYSYDDVNVDMNSSPSSSGREMNDDSDDDAENDEIQVTSDDDSPTHEHGSHSNLGQVKSAICIDENTMRTNTNIKSTVYSEKDENESLNWSSSQFKTESKTDNAIDMSTFTNSNCEKKLEIFSSKNNAFQTATINSARKESSNSKQSDRRGLIKIEAGLVDCNGYDDFKSLISSCRSGISRIDKKEGNHDNHRDIDEIKNKLPYQDDYIHRRELVSSEPNHTERTSNTFNCYRPEQLDDRRHQLQPNRDSNSMESMDNDLVETELHINAEKRGRIYQVPISESVNVHGDAVGWAEMPKSVLLRDRLSAFSALCIRNNSIYSPVQLRQSLVSNNRLLPKTETVRTDTQSSMISVSSATSSSSTSLTKRSAIGSAKGSYPIINNNCTSSHAKDDSK